MNRLLLNLLLAGAPVLLLAQDGQAVEMETFQVRGHNAFLSAAPEPAEGKPWLWYAPTLGALRFAERSGYFEAFQKAGIAIAGFDMGEVRGSPESTAEFTFFYEAMVERGYSSKPILFGQSRGGLMTLAWAVRHPDRVRAWVGVYPVCNLASYPLGRSRAATLKDYGLPEDELVARLAEFNPIDQLAGLLDYEVPLFVVHGDNDVVVPYHENSQLLKERYETGGGTIQVKVIPGEGHKVSPSFFQCEELIEFVLGLPQ